MVAVNQIGAGEPRKSNRIVAKYPFGPPAAPESPECCKVVHDAMTVTWREPVANGGGAITGYHLELWTKGTRNWTKLNKKPLDPKQLSYRATGLTKDKVYCFRYCTFTSFYITESNNSILQCKILHNTRRIVIILCRIYNFI